MRHLLLAVPALALACAPQTPLDVAVRRTSLQRAQRPDTPGNQELFRFNATDVVEAYDSPGGRFRIHFTRAGDNAVPAADTNANGTPDAVETVGQVYDAVAAFYQDTLGFRPPVPDGFVTDGNGGDDRFDVYLVDFGMSADGMFHQETCLPGHPDQCTGYMVQENDFAGYGYPSLQTATKILASHEYFHAIQAAYDASQGSVISEGTAVWATEKFDGALHDFEAFIPGYLENPDHSLDLPLPGPVDSFSYGSALFFWFLDEKYGGTIIRDLWEAAEDGAGGVADPTWFAQLPKVLAAHGTSFPEAFTTFATWNLRTSRYFNAQESYAHGNSYPLVRVDPAELPFQENSLRCFYASVHYLGGVPGTRAQMTAAVVPTAFQPDALTGLKLLVATRSGNQVVDLSVVDATGTVPVLDTSSADEFILAVINTGTSGTSRRPGICMGSPAEVETCKASLSGSTPDAGSPAVDAGVSSSSSSSSSGGASGDDDDDDDGGNGPLGCSHAGHVPLAAGLLLLLLRRRR